MTGTLVPGAPASYAIWEADELEVSAPADAVQRWSTDRRSRVPALPRLDDPCRGAGGRFIGVPSSMARFLGAPRVRGTRRRRDWAPATDDTDISPAVAEDDETDDETGDEQHHPKPAASDKSTRIPAWTRRFGQAVVDRLAQLGVTIVAGLALCVSFPPFGWWFMAIAAFGLLAWVLTRETTTRVGGFGYGFLFGLVFYLPLLPWISGLVGPIPWIALSAVQAVFPALFGFVAVSVRHLPGWPFWFAALWAAQEWLKSTVPFGGFPWGVVAFSQTDGPLLAIAQLGGAPLLSFAVALIGFSLGGNNSRDREVVAPQPRQLGPRRRLRWCCPACASAVVLLTTAWRGRTCGSRVSAPATTRRSPSPPCRATCRGSGWTSTPSGAPCWTTTSAKRFGWPRTCAQAGRRSRCSSSGRRTPRTSIRWRNPDARDEISAAAAAIHAPILVGGVVAAPRLQPRQPGVDQLGDRLESRHRPRRTARQADRPAVRRVPAVARLLQPSVAVRRPGGLLRARRRQRGGARGGRARSG